jgi:hypothetical protein
MREIKETSPTNEMHHGHKAVGATAVKLTPLEFTFNRGIRIRAPGANDPVANTLAVWVGDSGVTADSVEGSGGYPLAPGESVLLQVDDPTKIYVISTAGGQDVSWVGA